MSKDVMCNSTDGICLVKYMRDGIGSVSFNLALSNELETSEWFMNYWFIDGTIYNSWGGRMFHPEKDPCFHDRLDLGAVLFQSQICCTNYFNITIPDSIDDYCLEFHGETNFTNNNATVSTFKANYFVSNTSIKAQVMEYSGPSGNTVAYYFQPNSDIYISGCYGQIPGCVVEAEIVLPDHDHTFNFVLDIWNIPYWDYNTINGQLINRNGIWIKNNNQPYSPSDPCWTRVVDSNNNTVAHTKFCCSKWEKQPTCVEYRTKTVVNKSDILIAYLSSNIILNVNKTVTIQMLNYTTTSNNIKQNVQIESRSTNGNADFCKANSTNFNKNCTFQGLPNVQYTLSLRNSDYPDGWNMVDIVINKQQLLTPNITPSNSCFIENHQYNGIEKNTYATTEICCITTLNGPWPGSF